MVQTFNFFRVVIKTFQKCVSSVCVVLTHYKKFATKWPQFVC
jgi:hypothetical protein